VGDARTIRERMPVVATRACCGFLVKRVGGFSVKTVRILPDFCTTVCVDLGAFFNHLNKFNVPKNCLPVSTPTSYGKFVVGKINYTNQKYRDGRPV
jgi:hypothetical protein